MMLLVPTHNVRLRLTNENEEENDAHSKGDFFPDVFSLGAIFFKAKIGRLMVN